MAWTPDDEAEREMEEARDADRGRSAGPLTMGQVLSIRGRTPPRQPAEPAVPARIQLVQPGKVLRCHGCGHEGSGPGWRTDPRDGFSGILCAGRHDETGLAIDCYDRINRELALQLGRQVEEERQRARAAKERGDKPRERGYDR